MNVSLKNRLLRLEQSEIGRAFALRPPLPGMFEEMHISDEDCERLDVVCERGEPVTPHERGAMDRFLAEYERAFNLVGRAQNTFR
jgi:hypothetical protein